VLGDSSVKPEKGYDGEVTRNTGRLVGIGLVSAIAAAGPAGCDGDHSALAKRPTGGAGGGESGAAGSGGAGAAGGGGGAPLEAGSDASVEPQGTRALTFVHGVVDAETIAFCFARANGGDIELLGDPIPKSGLAYGAALALSELPGIDLAKEDFIPFVVAADATLLSTSSCATLDAQANVVTDAGADAAPFDPAIRSRALALIPAATLSDGYSYLLVAAGCLGAPSHTDAALDQSVCGTGYAPSTPTLTPVVVQMSRLTQPDRLGLQVVHASVATESVSVRSLPAESSLAAVQIAYEVSPGAIAPRPPNLAYGSLLFGTPLGDGSLEVASAQSATFSVAFSWATALSLAKTGSVADGRTYALVLLGPRIIVGQTTSWWNPPALTLVPTEPAF
jgi:hypothetical protein